MKNMKKSKLISVVMPVYNAGEFLVDAIESIRNQTYTNWELIAVNDGSTDRSLSILKRYARRDKRIKIINLSPNKGLATALNAGLTRAKGFYFARMDADDISMPKRFEKQVEYIDSHPGIT